MRKKTCGFKPLGLAAGNDGYGYLASSKTSPRTHTSLSFPSFPPLPPHLPVSLFSLSLAEARPSASRQASSRAHTKGSEKTLYRADRYGQNGHARDFP
jgi:hypothetical protein